MVSALHDVQGVVGDFVDEPVFALDSSGPVTALGVLQRFRLADAVKRAAANTLD